MGKSPVLYYYPIPHVYDSCLSVVVNLVLLLLLSHSLTRSPIFLLTFAFLFFVFLLMEIFEVHALGWDLRTWVSQVPNHACRSLRNSFLMCYSSNSSDWASLLIQRELLRALLTLDTFPSAFTIYLMMGINLTEVNRHAVVERRSPKHTIRTKGWKHTLSEFISIPAFCGASSLWVSSCYVTLVTQRAYLIQILWGS